MNNERAAVTVYTLSGCLYCQQARALLRRRGVPFTEILGDGEPGFRRRLLELTGRTSVPQITVDGDPVGGASDLTRLDRRGLLLPIIRREPFPRAVVVRHLNPVGMLTAPFGGRRGLWRHVVEVVERDGHLLERFPAGSAELAVLLADSLNEQDARVLETARASGAGIVRCPTVRECPLTTG